MASHRNPSRRYAVEESGESSAMRAILYGRNTGNKPNDNPLTPANSTDLVEYTTDTVYYHYFLHWVITCPVATNSYGFALRAISQDDQGSWHLMPSTYTARCGDIVVICIGKWRMPHVADSWGNWILFRRPWHDHPPYLNRECARYPTDEADLVKVAWRYFDSPRNEWFDAHGSLIYEVLSCPDYNESPH